VIAHELTHVAHPSPVPRFFDDDDRGPEERQAEQVAAVMRRAPVLPRTPAPLIQRSTTSSSPGTVSAAALAASIDGDTVQRKVTIGKHRTSIPSAPPTQPTTPTMIPTPPPQAQPAEAAETASAAAPSTDVMFDRILELLEDRILTELERRGGRFRGGF
jgi:hypothetical protein